MAKPILYYALVKPRFMHRDGGIIEVTSEQRGQVYGRYVNDGAVTHVSKYDIVHRFKTREQVDRALIAADKARVGYAPLLNKARKEFENLEHAQRNAIAEAMKIIAQEQPLNA